MLSLAPRLFISYSRKDSSFVKELEKSLREKGFKTFRDTSDMFPGDQFSSIIVKEIKRSNGLIAVISDSYVESLWCKAELYSALSSGKLTIPIVFSQGSLNALDEPLRFLLQGTNRVEVPPGAAAPATLDGFATQLEAARARRRREIVGRLIPVTLGALLIGTGVSWAVTNLNQLDQARRRAEVISELVNAKQTIQHPRIVQLASVLADDRGGIGEVLFLTHDPAVSDIGRFNALALEGELRKGQKAYRWYPRDVKLDHAELSGIVLANISFLGGTWGNVKIDDVTFSGAFWPGGKGVALSGTTFSKVLFYGSEFQAITAVGVSFVNSKFRGSSIDTTNFSKVRFATETPKTEGNPIITPDYTLFERSVLISRRDPPVPGVVDLTAVGDDIVFDGVMFKDCRLEGWFRPEWFRNSSFEGCELPESLSKEALRRTGNQVD